MVAPDALLVARLWWIEDTVFGWGRSFQSSLTELAARQKMAVNILRNILGWMV